MIDVLISGRLHGVPVMRAIKPSKPFALFDVLASDKVGENVLCKCITFSETAMRAVQALANGDSISVAGDAGLPHYSNHDGALPVLSVTVYGVLSAFHAGRELRALATCQADR